MIPEHLRRSFTPATLQTLEKHADRLVVTSPLFFRTPYAANVTENRRRSYMTVVVVNAAGVSQARGTCLREMPMDSPCWHLGAMLNHCVDPAGILLAERFEASLWRAVGFELAGEGRPLETDTESDPREAL